MSIRNFFLEELYEKERSDQIINYKYSGNNSSILYEHVTGPFAQYIVDTFFPACLALAYQSELDHLYGTYYPPDTFRLHVFSLRNQASIR